MGLLELLQAGDVETFNMQRGERSRLDLYAAELAEKNLCGVDLSGANLDKSDFTDSDLTDATLVKTSMTGIDGSGMKMVNALGVNIRLKEAWLDGADLSGADFSRGNLSDACLEGSLGVDLALAGAKLRGANVKGAKWRGVDLAETHMHKADFTGADLSTGDLTEASGAEIVLDSCLLDGVTAINARFPGAQIKGASAVGARFTSANLSGADLSGSDFTNADLSGANLTDAVLTGAIFKGTVLADACLDGVDFTDVSMLGADLSGVDPTSVKLSATQLEEVAAIGIPVDPEVALNFREVSAARVGDTVVVHWKNEEGEETFTLRYAVLGAKRDPVMGVLPVPEDSVLATAVSVVDGGCRIAVIRERPGGVAAAIYGIDGDGNFSSESTSILGYEPVVKPIARGRGSDLLLWGLARRGPTLVLHKLDSEGFAPIHSEQVATARGFLGRHQPVLACKGGVVMAVGERGVGKPLRTPEGFPGQLAVGVSFEDQVLAVWVEPRRGTMPGGLRYASLAVRGAPEVAVLSTKAGVTSMDAIATDNGVEVVWVEAGDDGLDIPVICRVVLPGGEPEIIGEGVQMADQVTYAPAVKGPPWIVLTTLRDEVVVLDEKGKTVVVFQDQKTAALEK